MLLFSWRPPPTNPDGPPPPFPRLLSSLKKQVPLLPPTASPDLAHTPNASRGGARSTPGGAMLRPSAVSSTSSAIVARARDHARSTSRALTRFVRPASFSAPPDSESAAVRAVRNISYFRTHYAVVLWVVLLITLAPRRRYTLFFLMAMSKVGGFYFVLLRAFPNSWVLQRLLDKRLVVALMVIVVLVQLVVTDAVGHSALALGVGAPMVIVHAVFRVRDDLEGSAVAVAVGGGEASPFVEKKGEKDLESSAQYIG